MAHEERGHPWSALRPRYFDGFHRCLPVLAGAGNNLIDYEIIHTFCLYDVEVDSTSPPDRNVNAVITAWTKRQRPNALDKMWLRAASP